MLIYNCFWVILWWASWDLRNFISNFIVHQITRCFCFFSDVPLYYIILNLSVICCLSSGDICLWLYVLVMSHMHFRLNPHYSCLNVKELFARSRHQIWKLSGCNWTWSHSHLVHKQTLNHLAKLTSLAK